MKYFNGTDWIKIPTVQGYSPSAKVERTVDGAVITITDKDGTTSVKVYDGSGGGGGTSIKEVTSLPATGLPNTIYVIKVDADSVESYIYLDRWYNLGAPDVEASDSEVKDLFK